MTGQERERDPWWAGVCGGGVGWILFLIDIYLINEPKIISSMLNKINA